MKKLFLLFILLSLFIVPTRASTSPVLDITNCHYVLVSWIDPPEIPTTLNSSGFVWFEGDFAPLGVERLYPLAQYPGDEFYLWYALFDEWDIEFLARNYWNIYGYVIINGNNYYFQNAKHFTCGAWLPSLVTRPIIPGN